MHIPHGSHSAHVIFSHYSQRLHWKEDRYYGIIKPDTNMSNYYATLGTHGYFCHEVEHVTGFKLSKCNEMCELDVNDHTPSIPPPPPKKKKVTQEILGQINKEVK